MLGIQGRRLVNAVSCRILQRSSSKAGMVEKLRGLCTIPPPRPQTKRLEGKTAMITGAASGIGERTARLLAAHGARVLVADVQDERGCKVAEELGNGSAYAHCDVRNDEEVAKAVERALGISAEKRVDVFHHNAGITGAVGPIDTMPVEEFNYTMGVNLRGAVVGMKHAARAMKCAGRGSIICTGSVASQVGNATHAYTISNNALVRLVRSLSAELRGFGVRVNMVSPGAMEMPPSSSIHHKVADLSLSTLDVANAALFLASDDSAYISGQNLHVQCANTLTKPPGTVHDPWYLQHAPLLRDAGKTGFADC
eukprot:Gb_34140 [translate_table: standard]